MTAVAAAIITRQGRVFIARRPAGKSLAHHWEFPGGKQEQGETLPQTLCRELREELNIEAEIGDFFTKSVYDYDFGTIEIHCYFAYVPNDVEIKSNEHEQTAWATPDELKNYTFAPADLPIVKKLQNTKL